MDPTVSSPVFPSSSWINSTACQNPVSERPCSKGLWSRLSPPSRACAKLCHSFSSRSLPSSFSNVLNDKTSPLLKNLFVPINDPATPQLRTTRGQVSSLLRVPFLPGPAGRRSIQFVSSILWNALPVAVRTEGDWQTFKALATAVDLPSLYPY